MDVCGGDVVDVVDVCAFGGSGEEMVEMVEMVEMRKRWGGGWWVGGGDGGGEIEQLGHPSREPNGTEREGLVKDRIFAFPSSPVST